jgi:hypothetical protein
MCYITNNGLSYFYISVKYMHISIFKNYYCLVKYLDSSLRSE